MKPREDRWWNSVAIVFLFLTLMMTAFRLDSTNWSPDLFILKWLTFFGFILGLGFGYSYFTPIKARIMLVAYSIIAIPGALTITTDNTLPWLQRLSGVLSRFGITFGNFFNNIQIEDPILFISFLAVVVWFTSLSAGYLMTRRGKPWLPLLVSAITIFSSEFYYLQNKNLYTSFFVIFALMVLSITNFMHSTRSWHKKGTMVEYETNYNISKSALIASIVLVLLAWNISGIVSAFQTSNPRQKLSGLFEDIRVQFTKITAPLQGPLRVERTFYGDSIGLGTSAVLGEDLIFTVSVDQFRPNGSRYYWRARTYDTYQDGLWTSTFPDVEEYTPTSPDLSYQDSGRYPLREFTFKTNTNLGLLYTPMYPIQSSREAKLLFDKVDLENIDLGAMTLDQTMFAGEIYQIKARIPIPTILAMRNAATEYPDWVTKKYLQLPEDFSPRLRELALEITKDETTVFDRVSAITNYLRRNISYQEKIPSPPENKDPVEWFLFDLKQGFCNYYASSEVLMLRSIGIPARMVYGYAQGEADRNQEKFTVLHKQSHAWPEVFFPGLGWVEFEPTSSQPTLTRLSGESNRPSQADILAETDQGSGDNDQLNNRLDQISEIEPLSDSAINRFQLVQLLPYLLIVALADLIALYIIRRRRIGISFSPPLLLESILQKRGWRVPGWLKSWSHFNQLSAAEKTFASIVFANSFLGFPAAHSSTPFEMVLHFSAIQPTLKPDAILLLDEYQRAIYSHQSFNLALMQRLSRKIVLGTLRKKVHLLFNPVEKSLLAATLD